MHESEAHALGTPRTVEVAAVPAEILERGERGVQISEASLLKSESTNPEITKRTHLCRAGPCKVVLGWMGVAEATKTFCRWRRRRMMHVSLRPSSPFSAAGRQTDRHAVNGVSKRR